MADSKPHLLQHILSDSASRFPDRDALTLDGKAVSYRTLEEKSNQLAHLLTDAGFRKRDTAAVLFDKSIEAIVTFFGVLKAGGAYISLDLNCAPTDRICRIIDSSETKFLVTSGHNALALATNSHGRETLKRVTTVLADGLIAQRDGDAPPDLGSEWSFRRYQSDLPAYPPSSLGTTADDLAYVLYTSGSTGEPKGVMLTHSNAASFVNWSLNCFHPSQRDVFANHAPFQFDLSVFDIYASLSVGARLAIAPQPIAANPRALLKWMADQKITFWYSVPSVWIAIMRHADLASAALDELRYVLFAGEVFPPRHLRALMKSLPQASFYNLYGPTETNVCMYYHVKDISDVGARPVPIGRACENVEVIALNSKDQPIVPGEEGELFVGGATVTSGYYRDEASTKRAFLKSPLPHHQGAPLYRTGDIVRRLDEEKFEYVGRRDLMVKCAGYRIELPEIENALCQNDLIEEAVVTPVFDRHGSTTRLHAFIKTKHDEDVSIVAVRAELGRLLPRYMLPAVIERIDRIPKNTNGKIDRQTVMNGLAS